MLPSDPNLSGPAASQIFVAARVEQLYAPVAADLQRVQDVFREELSTDQAFIDDLCRHVSHFHGKLLRPALVLICGRACGGELSRSHHVIGAVVEMVHIATLVHDDVLDEADTRRRVQTVNRMSGNERAVLLGDFLISHAFHLCSSLASQHASRRIGATTNEVCEGELMQVANRGNLDLSESLYFEIIRRKTASLIGVCCELGAWCSGAEPRVMDAMARFGISLGMAFQIIDDVLDLVGNENQMGKSLGRDLEMGKLTLPLIRYRDQALEAMLGIPATSPSGACPRHEAVRNRLQAALRLSEPARTREILGLLRTCDAMEYAQKAATNHVNAARECLSVLPASEARDCLAAMADFVVHRQK